jgi:hypothetical protein
MGIYKAPCSTQSPILYDTPLSPGFIPKRQNLTVPGDVKVCIENSIESYQCPLNFETEMQIMQLGA